jgi:nucleoid-associated protein YgaU
MEMSSPLRWLGAIAIMFIVVLIAVPMLIKTVGETVKLSSGASEDPLAALSEGPTESPSTAPEDDGGGGGNGGEGDGDFPQRYTVGDGDTGADISERFYGNPDGWSDIAEANDIDPSAPLRVGEELRIPAPQD